MKILLIFFILPSLLFAQLTSYDVDLAKEVKNYQNSSLLKKKYISLDSDYYKDYISRDININDQLTQPQRDLAEGTLYLQMTLISTIIALALMPESVSKWDKDSLNEKPLDEKWKENVAAGPVWDKDDFFINYIGHPVSGAWYYTMARNYGISPGGSFAYSVFLSTFIWEYGYEAFAEIPSWQDLFSTPIIGSLMGEYFYYLGKEIDKNNGEVWGSKTLGNISYFFIDPFGNMANGLSSWLDLSVTMRFQTYQLSREQEKQQYDLHLRKPQQFSQLDYGVWLNIEF